MNIMDIPITLCNLSLLLPPPHPSPHATMGLLSVTVNHFYLLEFYVSGTSSVYSVFVYGFFHSINILRFIRVIISTNISHFFIAEQ